MPDSTKSKKGTVVFLIDEGQSFDESYDFPAHLPPEETLRRLTRIAHARVPLLGSNVRIIRLKVVGKPLQKSGLRGTSGEWAWPRDALVLRNDGMAFRRRLRGFPRKLLNGDHSWASGKGGTAFREFNRALTEAGCLTAAFGGGYEAIGKLEPNGVTLLSHKAGKKESKKRIVALLGSEEGERVWDELKKRTVGKAKVM